MQASKFVGRVGGLAIALGIGAAAYGAAVASADADTARSAPDESAASQSSSTNAGAATGRRATTNSGPARTVRAVPAAAQSAAAGAERASLRGAPVAAPAAATPRSSASVRPASTTPEVQALADSVSTEPVQEPVALAATPALQSAAPTANSSADASVSSIFNNHITATPTVEWGGTLTTNLGPQQLPGVLTGAVNAVSSEGLEMAYVVVRRPNDGGKIGGGPLLPLTNFYGPEGGFSYIPYSTSLDDPTANEQFGIMAMELTDFDQALVSVAGKLAVTQLLGIVHRIPIIGDLLSPIIGQAKVVGFDVNPYTLAADRPTAFTYKMPSFDGTLISVNYFPATNVATGEVDNAPTVLAASGLACAANTDPTTRFGQLFPDAQFGSFTPGIAPLRDDAFKSAAVGGLEYDGGGGFNVVTWDPRGEFASEGQLQIDNPFFEGRDVSSIISWLNDPTSNPAAGQVKTVAGDPLVGMTGGSYGGGIQLTTVDPRIDGITPEIGWNSLLGSLYPDEIFKTGWGSILAAALAFTGARINPSIYQGILTGALFNYLSDSSQAVLGSVGPTVLLTKEQAPTMLFQGIHDTLFSLNQSVINGQTIETSPANPDLKVFWFCGGHGDCNIAKPFEQDQYGIIQNLMWMDQYVAQTGTPATDTIQNFQWFDQKGLYYNSSLLPWDPAFNDAGTYTSPTTAGGFLPIVPIIGGSGPYPVGDLPFSIASAGPARNSVSSTITPPAGKQVVGAPQISFTYSGLGTAQAVYAQLVDNTSGLVLSNAVTPIPVTLDGKTHTVTLDMEDIVYTAKPGETLTLQITSSAVNYEKFFSYGYVNISDVGLKLPQHTTVDPVPFVP